MAADDQRATLHNETAFRMNFLGRIEELESTSERLR